MSYLRHRSWRARLAGRIVYLVMFSSACAFAGPVAQFPNGAVIFHWTGVLLHAACTLLLFALLKKATNESWPSALTAFLFAVHPQQVESVAATSGRGDLVGALLSLATLWYYSSYARRPNAARYAAALLVFSAAVFWTPAALCLPMVFLAWDVWPLGRTAGLLREKLPFAAVAVALGAFLYGPMLLHWNLVLILAALTTIILVAIRQIPFLATGWLWSASTIVPALAIGGWPVTDHYSYLPSAGVCLTLVWGGWDLCRRWPRLRPALAGACALVCLVSTAFTRAEIGYWRDSQTFYQHAAAISANPLAHARLAESWQEQGNYVEAISECRKSLALDSTNPQTLERLGRLLYLNGQTADAIAPTAEAVRLVPDDATLRDDLGFLLAATGRTGEAVDQFETAVRLKPDYWEAHIRLGSALTKLGRTAEADAHFAIGRRETGAVTVDTVASR